MSYDDYDDYARADETMRCDPARLAAVAAQDERVREAYAKAHKALNEAYNVVALLSHSDRHAIPLAARGFAAIEAAAVRFANDAPLVLVPANECALGNRAAFGAPTDWSPPDSVDDTDSDTTLTGDHR
jgi:hypothetical protein